MSPVDNIMIVTNLTIISNYIFSAILMFRVTSTDAASLKVKCLTNYKR